MKYLKEKLEHIKNDVISASGFFNYTEQAVVDNRTNNIEMYNEYCKVYVKFQKAIKVVEELSEDIKNYYSGIDE